MYFFVTTSDFSESALDFAKKKGIVCLNGLQISTIIYDYLKNKELNFSDITELMND